MRHKLKTLIKFIHKSIVNRKFFIRFLRREKFYLSFYGLLTLLFFVVLIWLFYAVTISLMVDGLEQRGQSGDMFGGITALFSGLAFAGLIYTLFVQKKELQFQRQELALLVREQRETKGHVKIQADQLSAQSEFIEQQIFENRFFQMMPAFSAFVDGIQHNEEKGVDALESICVSVRPSTRGFKRPIPDGSIAPIHTYEGSFSYHKNDLAPYFRQIYSILKYVDLSSVKNPKFYTNILRARLCSAELTLLLLNGASIHGREKMAPLMKKYEVLKHFDDEDLISTKAHTDELREFYRGWGLEEKFW